jgi:hypothetical protein
MATITVSVTLPTLCGPVTFDYPVTIPGFDLDFGFFFNFFPIDFHIPFPDCSLFKRMPYVDEPESDSHPD